MLQEPLHSVVIGSLLGDACLTPNGRHWRLGFDHGQKEQAYVEWKYQMLVSIAASPPRQIAVYDKRFGKTYHHALTPKAFLNLLGMRSSSMLMAKNKCHLV